MVHSDELEDHWPAVDIEIDAGFRLLIKLIFDFRSLLIHSKLRGRALAVFDCALHRTAHFLKPQPAHHTCPPARRRTRHLSRLWHRWEFYHLGRECNLDLYAAGAANLFELIQPSTQHVVNVGATVIWLDVSEGTAGAQAVNYDVSHEVLRLCRPAIMPVVAVVDQWQCTLDGA